MEKPISYSVKDWLVKLTASELEIEESICDRVISWSYQKAREATKDNNSVEFSGFGKFLVSERKTKKFIKKREEGIVNINNARGMNNTEPSEKAERYKKEIEWLKTKLPDETEF